MTTEIKKRKNCISIQFFLQKITLAEQFFVSHTENLGDGFEFKVGNIAELTFKF